MLRFLLPLATLLLFSACGPRLSPLTKRLVDEQRWGEEELRRIQFYLSEDLVLTRALRNGRTAIDRGRVTLIDGREVEQVVFKAKTPGVFTFSPKDDRVAVSFEGGGSERYLVFGPNPKNGNRYSILARDWTRASGTVTYDGQEWEIASRDAFANLLIPIKSIENADRKGRVASGRKLR